MLSASAESSGLRSSEVGRKDVPSFSVRRESVAPDSPTFASMPEAPAFKAPAGQRGHAAYPPGPG